MPDRDSSREALLQREIERRLRDPDSGGRPESPLVRRGAARAPLAPAQRGIWLLHQFDPSSPVSNRPVAMELRGPLNREALENALECIVTRHEVLRTAFKLEGTEPVQEIQPPAPLPLDVVDLGERPESGRVPETQRLLSEQARRPFDLERGPLLRALLLRLEAGRHVLGLFTHHIVFDGWSERVLMRELKELYRAFSSGTAPALDGLPVQYADYAAWEADRLARGELEAQIQYWRTQLADVPPSLDLRLSRRPGSNAGWRSDIRPLFITPELAEQFRRLCRSERITLFMGLLAAFQLLMARYGASDDIITGVPAAGRSHLETEPLIGCFLRLLPLRTRLDEHTTVRGLLASVRDTALKAFANQEAPVEALAEFARGPRGSAGPPLFQTMFQLRNLPDAGSPFAGDLRITRFPFDPGALGVALSLEVRESGPGLECGLQFQTDLFDGRTVERMLEHYRNLLGAFADMPERPIWTLPMLGDAERRRILVEWNSARADYPADRCVHELFERQAEERPDSLAAVAGPRRITYGELDRKANQVARRLARWGAAPDRLVVLCVDKSVEALAGMMGILKAGAAYVPVDARLPRIRIEELVADAQPAAVVTQQAAAALFSSAGVPVLCLDSDWDQVSGESDKKPDSGAAPQNLAYVIYTSGSTGKPKGVAVEHRHLTCFLHSYRPFGLDGERPVWTNVASLSFDVSVQEIFSCLCFGGTVHLLRPELSVDVGFLARYLHEQKIKCSYIYPDLLEPLAAELAKLGGPGELKLLITGLAPMKQRALQAWRDLSPSLRIQNTYGPTEVTYGATAYDFKQAADPEAPVPIGKPHPNYAVYILDRHGQPAPAGVTGEIFIGGSCVGRGYHRRPDLTGACFLPDPFSPETGARMYRTGDLGRHLPDGNIEFLGRRDAQLKLRGFRIEPGEIEYCLKLHPAVRSAAVTVWEPSPGEKALAAYVAFDEEHKSGLADLRAFALERLPSYMIPSDWVELEVLPLKPSGKIDYEALPRPKRAGAAHQSETENPPSRIQSQLKLIWQELLGAGGLGLDDDFFEVGGHSLLAVRLCLEIERRFGVRLSPGALLAAPTVRKLAEFVEQGGCRSSWRTLVPLRAGGSGIPLFLPHGHEGNVFLYRQLAARIRGGTPVYGLQSAAVVEAAPPEVRVETMAAEFLAEIRELQPQGPYCLAGYCLGAYLAFEMARQLQAQGEEIGLLCVINTPGDWKRVSGFTDGLRYHWNNLRPLGGREKLRYLTERLGYRYRRIADTAARAWLRMPPGDPPQNLPRWVRRGVLRDAHVRAGNLYQPLPYRGNLVYLQGAGDSSRDHCAWWGEVVQGEIETIQVPGHASQVLEGPNADLLAERISALLAGAGLA